MSMSFLQQGLPHNLSIQHCQQGLRVLMPGPGGTFLIQITTHAKFSVTVVLYPSRGHPRSQADVEFYEIMFVRAGKQTNQGPGAHL